jgi:hypothetical protein
MIVFSINRVKLVLRNGGTYYWLEETYIQTIVDKLYVVIVMQNELTDHFIEY